MFRFISHCNVSHAGKILIDKTIPVQISGKLFNFCFHFGGLVTVGLVVMMISYGFLLTIFIWLIVSTRNLPH
jgi:hypothetical protein